MKKTQHSKGNVQNIFFDPNYSVINSDLLSWGAMLSHERTTTVQGSTAQVRRELNLCRRQKATGSLWVVFTITAYAWCTIVTDCPTVEVSTTFRGTHYLEKAFINLLKVTIINSNRCFNTSVHQNTFNNGKFGF